MKFYIFRSTTEKLPEHMGHIAESGDAVVADPVFVGGRDWVLLCRKGGEETDGLAQALGRLRASIDRLAEKIDAACARGARAGVQ